MSDAIADFYSKPSGQVGGGKQMGGPMSSSSKYAVPLWKGIKQEIREIVPKAISKLDGSSKIAPKLSKDVRSLGVEENGVKRYRPKAKKVRFDSEDEEEPKYKHKRSRIAEALGDDTW